MSSRRIGIVLALLASSGTAVADDRVARADQLFEEGKAMLDKDLASACAKFEESLKFNSQAIGTLLNVALCDEKLGRFASATTKFAEARDRAKEQGMAVHLKAAEEHIAALADKVPHVTLKFSEPPLPQTTIVIDERLIPFAEIANHPIDPGAHDVVVSAPGHLAFKTHLEIAAGENKDLPIPPLQKSVTVKSSRRTIGKITTATGVATLGTGIVLAIVAKRRYDDATGSSQCNFLESEQKWQCNSEGYAATGNARTLGNVATVVGGIGLVAVGVGAFLWLGGAKDEQQRVTVLPQVSPDGAGIAAVGRF